METDAGFHISLLSDEPPGLPPEPGHCYARIRIGEFVETFLVYLEFWSREDYLRQWREALDRLLHGGADSTALFTYIVDPGNANFFFWWPMWRDGSRVHVQNCMLFLDDCLPPFTLDDPYRSIPPRTTVTEEGERVSEWETSIEALKAFYRTLCSGM